MVVPRLCLSALKLSQPLLINRVTGLLGEGLDEGTDDVRYALIAATGLLYVGLAITTALYQRELHRMITKVRGALVTAVFAKSLRLNTAQLTDSAAITLISADVDRICGSLKEIDDLFATPIEIAVAIFLLRLQIGVSCIAPVALSAGLTIISFYNANFAVPMQRRWLAAVTKRIAYTSSVLGSPKDFKMLGLTDYFTTMIQSLRIEELNHYAAYRKYVTWRNVFSHIPTVFATPLTLMMFTLINGGEALTTKTAFTTLALVALLTTPTQSLIFAIPNAQTALASFERIQKFLSLEDNAGSQSSLESSAASPLEGVELSDMNTTASVRIDKATIVVGSDRREVLRDITVNVAPGSVTILAGPVGCGKSVLLHAIMGEALLSQGSCVITGQPSFAFCSQDTWLPNKSVRNLVVGQSSFDPEWYSTVVSACSLLPDIACLPTGDETFIGTKGVSLSGGQRQRLALARAVYARKRVLLVDDILSGADVGTSKQVFALIFGPRGLCKRHGMTVVLSTHQNQFFSQADHIIILRQDGTIAEQGHFSELDASKDYAHDLKSPPPNPSETSKSSNDHTPVVSDSGGSSDNRLEVAQQDLARKTGDVAVYSYYIKSIGWKFSSIVLLSSIVSGFVEKFPDLWVRWWSTANETGRSQHPLGVWIGVAFLLATVASLAVGAAIWTMLVHTVPKSSAQLHKQILDTVMRASYSFFVATDSGTTLNRFSTDMGLIEKDLAGSVLQFLEAAAVSIFSAVLIFAGADYAGATAPLIIGTLYLIQRVYLRTSRQLRFLELEAQAPLLTQCTETLAGVTTIRAFGWQQASNQELHSLLDNSQKVYYLMLCIQRWLGLVLGFVTAAIAIVVVAIALTLRRASSPGAVGVSLLGILSFSGILTYTINAWTTLETSLGAVARCKNFEASTIPEDREEERHEPPANWPANGSVSFQRLSASYSVDGSPVLKYISLSIAAGEKVGICGRTGSGKTSLLLTLFRLLDASSGTMEVDGIDLSTVPRQTIRERFTALPQEVITFPGTVGANVNPLGKRSSKSCKLALQKVGLAEVIARAGGLEADMSSVGLSQGQLQLFALARALLQKSNLLVVDEMTSSVDSVAEEVMLQLIKEEFKESTVIAVAHRLQAIMDFDRIVVMDNGSIAEMGAPADLLQRQEGLFHSMWSQSG